MNGLYNLKRRDDVIETYRNGDYELGIVYDTNPDNPRGWADNSTMVCWHNKYNLGDEHGYDDPDSFLQSLLMEILEDGGFDASGLIKTLKDKHDKYRFREVDGIVHVLTKGYSYSKKRKEWYDVFEFEGTLQELALNDYYIESLIMEMSDKELKEAIRDSNKVTILPLYLYDHSGISMSTGSFIGRAVHAEWDSGQVGWIYAYNNDNETNLEQRLKNEVEIYSSYIEGEVYGYELYENDDLIDSCYGFYGSDAMTSIKEHLPDTCRNILE